MIAIIALWIFVVAFWSFQAGMWWARRQARTAINFHKLMIAEMARVRKVAKWFETGSGWVAKGTLDVEIDEPRKLQIIIKETA